MIPGLWWRVRTNKQVPAVQLMSNSNLVGQKLALSCKEQICWLLSGRVFCLYDLFIVIELFFPADSLLVLILKELQCLSNDNLAAKAQSRIECSITHKLHFSFSVDLARLILRICILLLLAQPHHFESYFPSLEI